MQIPKFLILNKKEGETPLECLGRFRGSNKIYRDVKMTYAGRLDPMASGLLLVLLGEEVKNKEEYLKLDKEYEFEVLFGFATDTYDVLGKVMDAKNLDIKRAELEKIIKNNIKHFTGKFIQKYPIYSSKTVLGKPLFEYGRGGLEVEAPEQEVFVASLKFIKIKKVKPQNLLKNIEKRITKVTGDFRQQEILKIWRKKLNLPHQVLNIGSFKIKCGSGTYVRGIADSLGEKTGIPALAYSIKRTKVGKFGKASKLR